MARKHRKTVAGKVLQFITLPFSQLAKLAEKIFSRLPEHLQKATEWTVKLVENIKNISTDPQFMILEEILKGIIPGEKDDKLFSDFRKVVAEWVPKILLETSFVQEVLKEEDLNKQLIMVLEKIKISSDDTKAAAWRSLASTILDKMADGKIDHAERTIILEQYYNSIYLPSKA